MGDGVGRGYESAERRSQQHERAFLAQRGEEPVDVGDHILRALRAADGLASTGVAPFVGTGPDGLAKGALDAMRDGDAAFTEIVGPTGEVHDGRRALPGAARVDVVAIDGDQPFDSAARLDRQLDAGRGRGFRRGRYRGRR